MLQKVYGLPPSAVTQKEHVIVEAIALQGVPKPIESGVLRSKVFFPAASAEEPRAEMYVNVDFPQ